VNEPATIRPALSIDAPELSVLAGELGYPSTAEELERRLAPLLGDPSQLLLVAAAADDCAVGWLHATVRRQLDSDDFVEVVGLVVGASQRGAGVGAQLLACAEAWALERGVALVQLRSNVIRERAHGFYLRAGYERVKSSYLFRRTVW
jgi:GNAT superfamily N-acetyltransferase